MTFFLTAGNLSAPGIAHAFSTREGLAPQNIGAGVIVTCRQVHSPDAVTVTTPWADGEAPKADALVTNVHSLGIGIRTADCAPVLFADANSRVIGAAHAGWRGALAGVLESTLIAMEKLGAKRANIRAAVGPCIGALSYEVGPEFPAPFLTENGRNEIFFTPAARKEFWLFDLSGYVQERLKRAGIENIATLGHDTCAERSLFFSYRRECLTGEEKQGRQLSAIVLV